MCDSWEVIDSPNFWPALTTYHDQLVLVGGNGDDDSDDDELTNRLWVLQDGLRTWTQPLPPMPTRRRGASAVSIATT